MAKPIQHGTSNGYEYNKCRCDECRAWRAAKKRAYREQKNSAGPSSIQHGTYTAYTYNRCRCDECRAWSSATRRQQREAVASRPPSDPSTFKHGTYTGYRTHKCRCDECRGYNTRAAGKTRERRSQEPSDPTSFEHGTSNAYNYRGCRCDECCEWMREYQRNHYATNPEKPAKASDAARKRRQADPDVANERQRNYRASNRERTVSYKQARRARESPSVPFTPEQLKQRLDYYGNQCYLKLPGICTGGGDHIDHVKPLSKGGAHMLANLRPACKPCNSFKSAKWPFSFPKVTR